jgi:hypothetical protein
MVIFGIMNEPHDSELLHHLFSQGHYLQSMTLAVRGVFKMVVC